VRARRRGRHHAAERGREPLRLLGPLVSPGDAELAAALPVFTTHEGQGMFDAVLAATAMACGAEALVSADQTFADVPGLRYFDLAGPQALGLLEP
jgi:predicted nucleic acid-binding protein